MNVKKKTGIVNINIYIFLNIHAIFTKKCIHTLYIASKFICKTYRLQIPVFYNTGWLQIFSFIKFIIGLLNALMRGISHCFFRNIFVFCWFELFFILYAVQLFFLICCSDLFHVAVYILFSGRNFHRSFVLYFSLRVGRGYLCHHVMPFPRSMLSLLIQLRGDVACLRNCYVCDREVWL